MSIRAKAWNAVMTAEPGEKELEIPASTIEGALPPELAGGRHLQNGPGWTKIGGRLEHPFGGHGFVRSLSFTKDGGASFRSRFVKTPSYLEERSTGRGSSRFPLANIRRMGQRNVSNT